MLICIVVPRRGTPFSNLGYGEAAPQDMAHHLLAPRRGAPAYSTVTPYYLMPSYGILYSSGKAMTWCFSIARLPSNASKLE